MPDVPRLKAGHYMYFIEPSLYDEKRGYRVSIVIEGHFGYCPTGGGDVEPYYWGHDLKEAEELAKKRNKEMLGLSEDDMNRIMISSMKLPVFEVEQYETHASTYRVTGVKSEAEAIAAVLDREFGDACVELVDGSFELIEINKDVGMSTEQEPGTSITDQLHSLGIATDEYFIPSIRDVRRIIE